jgi:hypothetical protein
MPNICPALLISKRICEGLKMGRLLRDILFFFRGQDPDYSPAGKGGPSVLRKACLLDKSKKVFFLEPVCEERDPGIGPGTKPEPGEESHP